MKIYAVCTPAVERLRDEIFLPSLQRVEPGIPVHVENLEIGGNGDFGKPEFKAVQVRRIELICGWIREQRAGDVIFVSDIDILYLRPFAEELRSWFGPDCRIPVAFQRESKDGGYNVGQMLIMCGPGSLDFFSEVLSELKANPSLWEQKLINEKAAARGWDGVALPATFANTKTGNGQGSEVRSFHVIGTWAREGKSSLQLKMEQFCKLLTATTVAG